MTGLFRVPYVLFVLLTHIQRIALVAVGVDNAWEQKKPEARKMLVNRADSHTSGAPTQDGGHPISPRKQGRMGVY